ncbi:unnamed protein product, partial [Rotaria sp. Silwood2]
IECNDNYISLRDLYEAACYTSPDYNCKLEYILLRAGFFDLSPVNLFEFHICSNHYELLTSVTRRQNCNICKLVFGQNRKSSTGGLRTVSKLIAMGLWSDHHLSTYDKTICATCRLKLEKQYNNDDIRKKCENIFKWLHDPMIVFTPEKTETTYNSSYYASSGLSDKKESFSHWLKEHGFNGRVQKTLSYDNLQYHSKTNLLNQIKHILLYIIEILAPNNIEEVWNDLIDIENEDKKNNYDRDHQIIMEALADAYSNSQHWSTKRQLLSIIAADLSFHSIAQYIPDITLWKFNEARRQAKLNGTVKMTFFKI